MRDADNSTVVIYFLVYYLITDCITRVAIQSHPKLNLIMDNNILVPSYLIAGLSLEISRNIIEAEQLQHITQRNNLFGFIFKFPYNNLPGRQICGLIILQFLLVVNQFAGATMHFLW